MMDRLEALRFLDTALVPALSLSGVSMITVGPAIAAKIRAAVLYADDYLKEPVCNMPVRLIVNFYMPKNVICCQDSSGKVLQVIDTEEESDVA
jgi:hypothetical protein